MLGFHGVNISAMSAVVVVVVVGDRDGTEGCSTVLPERIRLLFRIQAVHQSQIQWRVRGQHIPLRDHMLTRGVRLTTICTSQKTWRAGIADGAPTDCSLLYLYDKGPTAIDIFAGKGVLVMTPWMKRQNEAAVSQQEATASRGVTASRIIIEQVFGNMRTFKVISETSRPSRGHEMDLEMELARCLVNWWPPVNAVPTGW